MHIVVISLLHIQFISTYLMYHHWGEMLRCLILNKRSSFKVTQTCKSLHLRQWSNVQLIQEKAHSSLLYPLHHPLSYMYFLFVSCYHFLILSKVRWENQSGLRAKADKQHEDKLLTSQTVKCHIARTYVFKSSQDGNRKRRYVLLRVKKRVIKLELWVKEDKRKVWRD